jgi:aspartate/methionine/tyrosine aminotransferase
MELPLAPYLWWAKSRKPAAIDLAGSNLLHCTLDDLPGVRDAIDLSAPNDNGYAPLVDAIAAHYGVSADRIVSADGCSGANFVAIAALAGPGDDVLIERPGYDPLIGGCRLMRANVRRFDRRFEDGFAMDSGRLAREITPRTKLIIVTNPHNPSGTVLGAGNLEGIGRVAEQAGALVLVDEVYLDAAMLAAGRAPTSESVARLGPPFIVTNSLTKSYGLAGLRNGWIVAPDAAVAERMRRTRDVIDNANSAPSDRLARLAFAEMPRLAERAHALLAGNLRTARQFFKVHAALELAHEPASSVVFPRLRGQSDADAFVRALLDRGVAVAPGRFFDAPGHFRISLAGRPDALGAGLTALSAALDARLGPGA